MDLVETGLCGEEWIGLAQYRYKRKALVNLAIKYGFHKMLGNYQVAAQLVAIQVALSFIELVRLCGIMYYLSHQVAIQVLII
jgi:hypothetical protein